MAADDALLFIDANQYLDLHETKSGPRQVTEAATVATAVDRRQMLPIPRPHVDAGAVRPLTAGGLSFRGPGTQRAAGSVTPRRKDVAGSWGC